METIKCGLSMTYNPAPVIEWLPDTWRLQDTGDYGSRLSSNLMLCSDPAQVKTLANIQHQQIVRLLCCCTKQDRNLLVYEYMPQGQLGRSLGRYRGRIAPMGNSLQDCYRSSHGASLSQSMLGSSILF